MKLIVVKTLDDATGQGKCLYVFLLAVEHVNLSFQGNDGGIEPVELPVLAAVENGYHTVKPCHAPLALPHCAEHGTHLGLCAQGFRLSIVALTMTHLHQLL